MTPPPQDSIGTQIGETLGGIVTTFLEWFSVVLTRFGDRFPASYPDVPIVMVLITAGIAVLICWPTSKLYAINTLGVITHEFGHVAGAVLIGGRPDVITLHDANSGEATYTYDLDKSPALASFAGYCAPALAGLGAAALLAEQHAGAVLGLGTILCLLTLLFARDPFTIGVVLLCGAVCVLVMLYAPPIAISVAAYLLAWIMLASGLESAVGRLIVYPLMAGEYSSHDDGFILAEHTGIPRFVWILGWIVVCGACTWTALPLLWP